MSAFTFTQALVRPPSPSLVDALGQVPGITIDHGLALRQHASYVEALRWLGLDVVSLAPLDAHPDACFVEDTAVVFGDSALSTRPGAASRRDEAHTVAAALGDLGLSLTRMEAPATLDGGDVLRVGNTFFVGRSERTNQAGIEALLAFSTSVDPMARVIPVDMPAGLLHLKCEVSALGDDAILVAEDLALDLPRDIRRVNIPRAEAFAANAVANGARVLIAADHPRTAAALLAAGFSPRPLVTSEFKKAAGSLTCLSVLC